VSRTGWSAISIVAVVALAAGIWRFGAEVGLTLPEGTRSLLARGMGFEQPASQVRKSPEKQTGPVIYYRDPDGKPFYSDKPKVAGNDKPYLPVHSGEDVGLDDVTAASATAASGGKRIRFYRNPMGLADVSPTPKKDSMGMDYLPVYEGDGPDDDGAVRISPERIQRSGVRTETVRRHNVGRSILAPGIVRIDEGLVKVVALRGEGYIEELFVNRTGQSVKAGQPLFRVYMPQLPQAQIDLLLVLGETGRPAADQQRVVQNASQKLRNLGVPDSFIRAVIETRTNIRTIDWPSPMNGVVIEKRIVEGQRAMPGDELYRIADLSSVWLIAEVPESDLAEVRIGDLASLTFRAFPGETRESKVSFIYPDLNPQTRTARLRLELPNPDGRLRADMYADVSLRGAGNAARAIAVSTSAVIENGPRRIVIVAKGDGRFEPRPVKIGRRGDSHIEIVEGLRENEEVVTAATFLIDAESNLQAALKNFTAPRQNP